MAPDPLGKEEKKRIKPLGLLFRAALDCYHDQVGTAA
jgi:hypothetical protein